MRAIIKRSKDRKFYFIIKAANGQTIAHSETYTQKHNAKSAIELLQGTEYEIIDETGPGTK